MVRDRENSTRAADEKRSYHMLVIAVKGMGALSGQRSASQNASPRTSWPGHLFAGFVLTIRSQRGAVKRVPRYWRDKQNKVRIAGLDDGGSNIDP